MPDRSPTRSPSPRLIGGLLTVGLLLLAAWSWNRIASQAFQGAESKRFEFGERPIRTVTLAYASTEPAGRRVEVLGRVEIPRLGIGAVIAEGVDLKLLARAVGHLPSTARPGRPGNCALAGHRDSFFRGLGGVRGNDFIRVVTLDRTYTYEVDWIRVVDPHEVEVLDSTDVRSLTLITCYPFRFVGRAPQRFIVRARQVDSSPRPEVKVTDTGRLLPAVSD